MHLDIAPGGEFLLPFARKKLAELHAELIRQNRSNGSRFVYVTTDETVFIHSQKLMQMGGVAPQFLDSIRITAGGIWDFYVDIVGTDGLRTAYLFFIGKSAPKVVSTGAPNILYLGVKSFKLPFLSFVTAGNKLKQLKPNGALSDYGRDGLTDVYTDAGASQPAVSGSRFGEIISTPDNLSHILMDGVSEQVFDDIDGTGSPWTFASNTDMFAWEAVNGTGVRVVSLTSGLLVDAATAIGGQVNPVCNLYDIFTVVSRLSGPDVAYDYYIGGSLVYSDSASGSSAALGIKATKDGFFFLHDNAGEFNGGNSAASGITERITLHKFLRNPDTGAYSRTTRAFDFILDSDGMGYAALEVSASEAYVYVRYRLDSGGPTDPTMYIFILSSAGSSVLYDSLDTTMVSDKRDGELVTTPNLTGTNQGSSIPFVDHCVFLAKFQNSGFANINELRWIKSDGTGVKTTVIWPDTYHVSDQIGTLTEAYAAVFSGSGTPAISFFTASGAMIDLLSAFPGYTLLSPGILLSDKAHAYLLLAFLDVDSNPYIAHVTEELSVFGYQVVAGNYQKPAPLQLCRMQELEAWAA